MEQTTLFSQIVLALWVPVSIAFFLVTTPQRATVLAALGSELFMPELTNFKFPFMPAWDKHNLPYVCILIGCLIRCPRRVTKVPSEKWVDFLTLLLVVGAILTGLTNKDFVPLIGSPALPGLDLKDAIALMATTFLATALPFYIGYSLFQTESDLRTLLAGFSAAAFIYIPFELWEVRMSPSLHRLVYGYFPHDFGQTLRWGGWRPQVFTRHGLALARFSFVAAMAPFAFRPRPRAFFGVPWRIGRWLLVAVLVLCKSTGAIVYTIVSLPIVLWMGARGQVRAAAVLAAVVLAYPALRLAAFFPVEEIIETSNNLLGPARTQSLQFRFENEDKLLDRARMRVVFGWGSYGRNFTYDRHGQSAVADGYWIIEFGALGVVGFIGAFGLLLVPIYLSSRRLKLILHESERKLVAGTCLILAVVSADLIPNGLWGSYVYLLAGALTSVTRGLTLISANTALPRNSRVPRILDNKSGRSTDLPTQSAARGP